MFLTVGERRIYYRFDGPDEGPVVVLAHSLGLDHGIWDPQLGDFTASHRVLRLDLRGHGASSSPIGPYSMDDLGGDVLALADHLGIDQFAYCGLSIGGMVGQWLGAHAGNRLSHLILANTSPRVADPPAMAARAKTVLDGGMAPVVELALSRYFTPTSLARRGAAVRWAARTLLATDPVGYANCCLAISAMDQRALLPSINVPTLVIAGTHDTSMPEEEHSRVLARSIRGARMLRLPTAHLSNLEAPRAFAVGVLEFLSSQPEDRRASGDIMRRRVLGDAHVDRAKASSTAATADFQQLITEYVWGTIWTRPGLDLRTRRLLVIAITAALGRWEEFQLHVRTGLANDLELCDIREVLLQTAAYAGVPAANTAFRLLQEEITESD